MFELELFLSLKIIVRVCPVKNAGQLFTSHQLKHGCLKKIKRKELFIVKEVDEQPEFLEGK